MSAPQSYRWRYRLDMDHGYAWHAPCRPVGKVRDAMTGDPVLVVRYDRNEPRERGPVWARWDGAEFVACNPWEVAPCLERL